MELVAAQAARAGELIEHLRCFAVGAEPGEAPRPVPLDAAVQGAPALGGRALRAATVEIEVALGTPPPVVLAHRVALEQALTNLLLNARDALDGMPPGAPRRVRIAAAATAEGSVRLTVADTGGGIAPEVLPRLFEPFATTKGPDRGTGLGLSICHGLMMAMGGGIKARNGAEGAVFTLTLQGAPG